jgi:hypothetical protein
VSLPFDELETGEAEWNADVGFSAPLAAGGGGLNDDHSASSIEPEPDRSRTWGGRGRPGRSRLWPWQLHVPAQPARVDLTPERPFWSLHPVDRGDRPVPVELPDHVAVRGHGDANVADELERRTVPPRPHRPWELPTRTVASESDPAPPISFGATLAVDPVGLDDPTAAMPADVLPSTGVEDTMIDRPPIVEQEPLPTTDEVLEWSHGLAPDLPRVCRTCRDFRPSEGGERGWCANEWAFKHPRMVHGNDEMPCESTLGSWWLPVDDVWLRLGDVSSHGQPTARLDRLVPAHRELDRRVAEVRERRRS